jgi:hypothetical protein
VSLSFNGAARDSCRCPLCVYEEGGGGAGEGRKTAGKRNRSGSTAAPGLMLTPWQLILVRHERR